MRMSEKCGNNSSDNPLASRRTDGRLKNRPQGGEKLLSEGNTSIKTLRGFPLWLGWEVLSEHTVIGRSVRDRYT